MSARRGVEDDIARQGHGRHGQGWLRATVDSGGFVHGEKGGCRERPWRALAGSVGLSSATSGTRSALARAPPWRGAVARRSKGEAQLRRGAATTR